MLLTVIFSVLIIGTDIFEVTMGFISSKHGKATHLQNLQLWVDPGILQSLRCVVDKGPVSEWPYLFVGFETLWHEDI